ncbi:glutamine amidotransferase, partial [Escherichia coli]|uniref:glutamine amidotransferase n=1 Tax=Escherichia coli TaxID=562 RepID=UPI003FD21AD0
SIKTITYLSDIGCLEIQGASLINNDPLLVFGNYHNGKIACFMSDCSPHWGTQQFMSWPFYTALWVNILTHIAR